MSHSVVGPIASDDLLDEEASPEQDHEGDYWYQHVRIGLSLMALTTLAGLAYVGLSWGRPNRLPLLAMLALAALGLGVLAVVPRRRLVTSPRRMTFFYAWSTGVCVVITAAALVDGGVASPLLLLLFLPLIYAAMAYPPEGVVGLGFLVMALFLGVETLQRSAVAPDQVFILSSSLALVAFMAALTARNHWDQQVAQTQLADRLTDLADRDGLTRCLNHRAFHEALQAEVTRSVRYSRPVSLLMADLDTFKEINDRYGHPVGDAVLRAVSAVLCGTARQSDIVARTGGEEFALLLPETRLEEATALAQRLREAVAELSEPLPVTVSIGVSALPELAPNASHLLEGADQALYAAKRAGRDTVRVAGTNPDREADRDQAFTTRQRRVLQMLGSGELSAVLQPIVSLLDGSVLGYEALSRIKGSSLAPDRWLAIAADCGLRSELEAAMWEAALRHGSPPGGGLLFLNVSPDVLLSGALEPYRDRLPLGSVIELSEEPSVDDADLRRVVDEWRAEGFQSAVDDIGAVGTNLRRVVQLVPEFLKLDRSLVTVIHTDPSRWSLVEAICAFARRTDRVVIAEGVQEQAEVDALLAAGVTHGQGRLLGRPGTSWVPSEWRPPKDRFRTGGSHEDPGPPPGVAADPVLTAWSSGAYGRLDEPAPHPKGA